MAECQFWKAKVVRHRHQKLVAKKCGWKKSSIRLAPMSLSGSASRRVRSARSRVSRPSREASAYGTVLQNDARLGVGGMFSVERQELLAH